MKQTTIEEVEQQVPTPDTAVLKKSVDIDTLRQLDELCTNATKSVNEVLFGIRNHEDGPLS